MALLQYYKYTYEYFKYMVRYVPITSSFLNLNNISSLNNLDIHTELICKNNFSIYCPILPIVYSSILLTYPNIFVNIQTNHSLYMFKIKTYISLSSHRFVNFYKTNWRSIVHSSLNSKFISFANYTNLNKLDIINKIKYISIFNFIYLYLIIFTLIKRILSLLLISIINKINILKIFLYNIKNLFTLIHYSHVKLI